MAPRPCRRDVNARTPGTRVALYSHDACGLGHVRRNLRLAGALAARAPGSLLVLAGSREAAALPIPPGVECVTLPGVAKTPEGDYRPRALGVGLEELLGIRSAVIDAALDSFAPDVVIVDKHPRGLHGELAPALEGLRRRGTRLVLGLRDVLDEPAAVRREWAEHGSGEAVARDYDALWVYGDPRVYDAVAEYGLHELAASVRYTGYLGPEVRGTPAPEHGERLALCLVGGGEDGAALAEAFVRAPLPAGSAGLLVAGPLMPHGQRRRIERLAAQAGRMRVIESLPEPAALMARAERVVAMGGYNTTCELLVHRKHALVVPRVRPRREQLIRAERLARRGLLDVLHPRDLSPEALGDWLAAPAPAARAAAFKPDLGGLARIPAYLDDVLRRPARARAVPAHA